MSVQLGCNFFHFGPNVNVCLIVQIEKEEQISVLQALLFKSTHLLHHLLPKKLRTYWSKFLQFTLRMPKRFYRKVKSKGFIQQQLHYSNREGFHLELLLVSKKHTMESPKIFKIVTVKKNINLKNVFLFE